MIKVFSNIRLQILIIVLLTVAAYSNIFQNGFTTDDPYLILNWQRVHNLSIIPEQPIVCTPEDAIRAFLASKLDVLVMEDYLIYRHENF